MELDEKNLIVRLRKVEGQVAGLIKMLEEKKDCEGIIIQFKAVLGAIKKIFLEYLKMNTKVCIKNDKQSETQFTKIMENLIKENF